MGDPVVGGDVAAATADEPLLDTMVSAVNLAPPSRGPATPMLAGRVRHRLTFKVLHVCFPPETGHRDSLRYTSSLGLQSRTDADGPYEPQPSRGARGQDGRACSRSKRLGHSCHYAKHG